MPERNGDVAYEVDFSDLLRQVVHFPNGMAVTTGFGTDATFNSLDALKAAFVGDWTIEIPGFGTTVPPEFYTFQISDFPQSLLYTIPPEITSPADGSFVPEDFTMSWAWPGGVTPPPGRSDLIRRSGPGNRTSSHEHWDSPASYLSAVETMRHNINTVAEKAVLRAGDWNIDPLAPYMSVVAAQQPNSRFDIQLNSSFKSYSIPTTVFLGVTVPEPAGAALLLTGVMVADYSRRRRDGYGR